MSKERPILFSAPMVEAILSGKKTQTRRKVNPQPSDPDVSPYFAKGGAEAIARSCPYGIPGDILWVREAWARTVVAGQEMVVYRAGDNRTDYGGPWKPGIHLFRSDARILLQIKATRVERLQFITGKDIVAEGAVDRPHTDQFGRNPVSAFDGKVYLDLASLWAAGWDQINGAGSFEDSPWVWVIEFERIKP